MIEQIMNSLSALPKGWHTFILAMLPISELRGAIPYGLSVGLPLSEVLILAVIGNLVPVVPILFLFKPVSDYLNRFRIFKKFFKWLFARTLKNAKLVEAYEILGLILFVGIPLPITGAWTGCLAALLFKVRLRYALLGITLGVLMSAFIVTLAYFTGRGLLYHVFVSNY